MNGTIHVAHYFTNEAAEKRQYFFDNNSEFASQMFSDFWWPSDIVHVLAFYLCLIALP